MYLLRRTGILHSAQQANKGHYGWSGMRARRGSRCSFAYIDFDRVDSGQDAKIPLRDCADRIPRIAGDMFPWLYNPMSLGRPVGALARLDGPHPCSSRSRRQARRSPARSIINIARERTCLRGAGDLMAHPRIFYSWRATGLLPTWSARSSRASKTPYITTIITAFVAAVVAGLFPIELLGQWSRSERLLHSSSFFGRDSSVALQVRLIWPSVPDPLGQRVSESRNPDLRLIITSRPGSTCYSAIFG